MVTEKLLLFDNFPFYIFPCLFHCIILQVPTQSEIITSQPSLLTFRNFCWKSKDGGNWYTIGMTGLPQYLSISLRIEGGLLHYACSECANTFHLEGCALLL